MAIRDPLDIAAAERLARLDPEDAHWLIAHIRASRRLEGREWRDHALRRIAAEELLGLKPSKAAREMLRAVHEQRRGKLLRRLEEALGDDLADLPGHSRLRHILGRDLATEVPGDSQKRGAA